MEEGEVSEEQCHAGFLEDGSATAKIYVCHWCRKIFSSPDSITVHRAKSHPGEAIV